MQRESGVEMEKSATGVQNCLNVAGFVGMLGTDDRRAKALRQLNKKQLEVLEVGKCLISYRARERCSKLNPGGGILITGQPFVEAGTRLEQATADTVHIDGKFVRVDFGSNRVRLETDVIGAGAVFYSELASEFYFGSHLGLLLDILPYQPKVNQLAVAGQLFARAQLFPETHFEGVMRLKAGSTIVAEIDQHNSRNKVSISSGDGVRSLLNFSAPPYGPETILGMIDGCVAREEFGPSSVLMLSGGRDSFAIALADAPIPETAATYGERYSMDFIRGKGRACQLDLKFLGVPYEKWWIGSYEEEIVDLNAGCSGLQTAHNIVAFDWVQEFRRAAVGFLGDALTGAHLGPGPIPDDAQVIKILLPDLGDPLLSESFPDEKVTVWEFVLSQFQELSKDIGRRRALMVLDLEWRQARWISMTFDLCDWFLPIAYPFFQKRLMASALQADDGMLYRQRAYDNALYTRVRQRGLYDSIYRVFAPTIDGRPGAQPARKTGIGRVDWEKVMERSGELPKRYLCGNAKLDTVTTRSWNKKRGKTSGKFPTACTAAAVGAAVNRFAK